MVIFFTHECIFKIRSLSFSPNSATSTSISAGYYSGGTLNSTGAYNAGRTQGQNDVKANPGGYGLEGGGSYNNGYNKGVADADNRANPNSTNYATGYKDGKASSSITQFTIHTHSTAISQNYNYPEGTFSGLPVICAGKDTLDITVTNNAGFSGYCYIYSPSGELLLNVTAGQSGASASGTCDISSYDYVTATIRTPAWGADGDSTITFTLS